MGLSESRQETLKCEFAEKFDNFDFRVNKDDPFTFKDRAKRELSGIFGSDDLMSKVFSVYREFMIDTAVQISMKSSSEPEKFIIKASLPPVVEEMWCLAILYSQKYKELCKTLVGATIERAPSSDLPESKYIKPLWPFYDMSCLRLDKRYYVWIHHYYMESFLEFVYSYLTSKVQEGILTITTEDLEWDLEYIHGYLISIYSSINLNHAPSEIPDAHPYFNTKKTQSVEQVLAKVLSSLPEDLVTIMEHKYNLGDKAIFYVKEYAKFMTMIYFSNSTLTPSEEVDYVWHLHQSFTITYKDFCLGVFDKFIDHTPTVGGDGDARKFREIYSKTLDFYRFLFKECPPLALWPKIETRFCPNYYLGGWYSLFRIYQATLTLLGKNQSPKCLKCEVMHCYVTWSGLNLLEKGEIQISFEGQIEMKGNES